MTEIKKNLIIQIDVGEYTTTNQAVFVNNGLVSGGHGFDADFNPLSLQIQAFTKD